MLNLNEQNYLELCLIYIIINIIIQEYINYKALIGKREYVKTVHCKHDGQNLYMCNNNKLFNLDYVNNATQKIVFINIRKIYFSLVFDGLHENTKPDRYPAKVLHTPCKKLDRKYIKGFLEKCLSPSVSTNQFFYQYFVYPNQLWSFGKWKKSCPRTGYCKKVECTCKSCPLRNPAEEYCKGETQPVKKSGCKIIKVFNLKAKGGCSGENLPKVKRSCSGKHSKAKGGCGGENLLKAKGSCSVKHSKAKEGCCCSGENLPKKEDCTGEHLAKARECWCNDDEDDENSSVENNPTDEGTWNSCPFRNPEECKGETQPVKKSCYKITKVFNLQAKGSCTGENLSKVKGSYSGKHSKAKEGCCCCGENLPKAKEDCTGEHLAKARECWCNVENLSVENNPADDCTYQFCPYHKPEGCCSKEDCEPVKNYIFVPSLPNSKAKGGVSTGEHLIVQNFTDCKNCKPSSSSSELEPSPCICSKKQTKRKCQTDCTYPFCPYHKPEGCCTKEDCEPVKNYIFVPSLPNSKAKGGVSTGEHLIVQNFTDCKDCKPSSSSSGLEPSPCICSKKPTKRKYQTEHSEKKSLICKSKRGQKRPRMKKIHSSNKCEKSPRSTVNDSGDDKTLLNDNAKDGCYDKSTNKPMKSNKTCPCPSRKSKKQTNSTQTSNKCVKTINKKTLAFLSSKLNKGCCSPAKSVLISCRELRCVNEIDSSDMSQQNVSCQTKSPLNCNQDMSESKLPTGTETTSTLCIYEHLDVIKDNLLNSAAECDYKATIIGKCKNVQTEDLKLKSKMYRKDEPKQKTTRNKKCLVYSRSSSECVDKEINSLLRELTSPSNLKSQDDSDELINRQHYQDVSLQTMCKCGKNKIPCDHCMDTMKRVTSYKRVYSVHTSENNSKSQFLNKFEYTVCPCCKVPLTPSLRRNLKKWKSDNLSKWENFCDTSKQKSLLTSTSASNMNEKSNNLNNNGDKSADCCMPSLQNILSKVRELRTINSSAGIYEILNIKLSQRPSSSNQEIYRVQQKHRTISFNKIISKSQVKFTKKEATVCDFPSCTKKHPETVSTIYKADCEPTSSGYY